LVAFRNSERGVALVFALATLTLVAITIAAVAGEIQSRGAGVVLEERAVRVIALSDAAMAESLAELAANGVAFEGITERWVEGGTITSTIRAMGEWEVEVVAIGRRQDWQATVQARVYLKGGPRVLWWQRTQGPAHTPTHPNSELGIRN
jgi:type II secretory pathway component PulK